MLIPVCVCCSAHMRTHISAMNDEFTNISIIEYSVKNDKTLTMSVFVCSSRDFCSHDVQCESLVAYAQDVFTHVTENNPKMCLREEKVGDDGEVVCWFIMLSLLLLTE